MRSSSRERKSKIRGFRAWVSISLLVVFMSLPVCTSAAWYDIHWQYRKEIAIDSSKVTADLTSFPVLFYLLDPDLDDDAQFDGDDILFTAADGTTKLSHEIEQFNGTTGRLVAWVKIPNLSSSVSTKFYIYYGNLITSNQEDAANVWDANFRGVWHLHDDFLDSTPNANNGLNSGSTDNAAKIADGQDFDGWNDYVDVGSDPSIDNVFTGGGTFSAWIYPQGWGEVGLGRIGDKSFDASVTGGWSLQLDNDIPASVRTIKFEQGFSFHEGDWEASTDAISLNTWQYVVVTYNDGDALNDPSMYVNGISQPITETEIPAGIRQSDAFYGLRIGNRSGSTDRTFNGLIDEVRISANERSSDWIQTEYNNQNDPASFYIISVEEIGNYDPTIAAAIADTTVAEDSPPVDNYRDLNAVFTDIEEGGALSFTVTGNSNPALVNVAIDADSALDLSFVPDQNGSATIVIRATDSGALSVEDTFTVTVT
ncbi:MAG: DUF2341 domain-containing protein, partial [bacterium]